MEIGTIPALNFIDKLVKLIPDENLKLIRYYGLYAKRTSQMPKMRNTNATHGHNKTKLTISTEGAFVLLGAVAWTNQLPASQKFNHPAVPLREIGLILQHPLALLPLESWERHHTSRRYLFKLFVE